jgi:hypothetical protein
MGSTVRALGQLQPSWPSQCSWQCRNSRRNGVPPRAWWLCAAECTCIDPGLLTLPRQQAFAAPAGPLLHRPLQTAVSPRERGLAQLVPSLASTSVTVQLLQVSRPHPSRVLPSAMPASFVTEAPPPASVQDGLAAPGDHCGRAVSAAHRKQVNAGCRWQRRPTLKMGCQCLLSLVAMAMAKRLVCAQIAIEKGLCRHEPAMRGAGGGAAVKVRPAATTPATHTHTHNTHNRSSSVALCQRRQSL